MIHHGLGEKDAALKFLEESSRGREVQLTFIKIDKRWDDIRAEPRFAWIVRQMKLD